MQHCMKIDYCSSKTKLRLYYQYGTFDIRLNCSHYNRIMFQRLHQYLEKYAFMQRETRFVIYSSHFWGKIGFSKLSKFRGPWPLLFSHSDNVEDIPKIHRKLFRSGGINSLYSSYSAYLNRLESSHAKALLKRNQDACILVMETFSTFK
ncbi:hypothetical protein T11_10093 [Trichinella zimbabwensis]|uniref:Uncharacterized protein n=1 Tax=Trichinella zimbabwensis TaxID=268475 RepID=A0A0V1GRF4_9BILA|nr:hypothetical protein T11_10093 [Trichinella zimbabwensis]